MNTTNRAGGITGGKYFGSGSENGGSRKKWNGLDCCKCQRKQPGSANGSDDSFHSNEGLISQRMCDTNVPIQSYQTDVQAGRKQQSINPITYEAFETVALH